MNSLDDINKNILGLVRDGKIRKELAFDIIKGLAQKQEKQDEDIAIIGMSCRLPGANNVKEYWNNIKNGVCCITKFPESRRKDIDYLISNGQEISEDSYSMGGYLDEIDKFDYSFFGISPSEAKSMDPSQRIFLETSWEALEDAGYGGNCLFGTNTGVYAGVDHMLGPVYRGLVPNKDMLALTGTWPGVLARRVSYIANFRGPAMVIDTACSSGLVALHTACKDLKNNDCQLALVGGLNIIFSPTKGSGLSALEASDGRVRSFDKNASGTAWSEGFAVVVVKPLKKAVEDGDSIYAVIKGSAVNNDGESSGITAPSAKGQEEVIIKAWKNAKINPESISYIEAHSTGTQLGDPIEIDGLTNAFRKYTDKIQFCGIGSVKPNIGHTVAASGIGELIKVVLSLNNELIPPSICFKEPNPYINFTNSPLFVNDKLRAWKKTDEPRRAGINSFAFSGTNCHVVVEEVPEMASESKSNKNDGYVFTITAKSKDAFSELVNKYVNFLQVEKNLNLSDICFTSNTGRGHYECRLAIISKNLDDLKSKLEIFKKNNYSASIQDDIYYGEHRIVSVNRKTKQIGEITEGEKRIFSKDAKSIISNGVNTDMKELCKLYIQGASVEWNLLYTDGKYKKVHLPVYPFERIRCWPDAQKVKVQSKDQIKAESPKKEQAEDNNNLLNIKITGSEDGEDYTDTEKKIAKIFTEALGIEEIDINDDFFEIGGNSLISIQIEAIAEKDNIKITSDDIYQYKTVRELAQFLDGHVVEKSKKEDNEAYLNNEIKNEKNINNSVEAVDNSKDRYIIENIEPFNELFYKNCFYNSCFPVIKSYGKSIIPYLVNDVCVYICESDKLKVKFKNAMPMEKILNKDGIGYEKKRESKDIINDLIENVSKNKPVIIWIDCFYESIRLDTFNKQHWPHTILIYGYDLNDKTFNIIEHAHRDNLDYMKRVISFEDIINCYNGYMENIEGNLQEPVFNSFYKLDTIENSEGTNDYKLDYLQNIIQNSDMILSGIEKIKEFRNSFEKTIMDKVCFFENGQDILKMLNDIINAKLAEKYKIEEVFEHQTCEAIEVLNHVIDQWKNIRGVVAKSIFSGIYNSEQNQSLLKTFEDIYSYELKYFESIKNCLKS